MNRLITKAARLLSRYRPEHCTETLETAHGVVYYSPDKKHAIAYKGTAGRPTWNFRFSSPEQCDREIASFFKNLEESAAYHAKRAEATRAARTNDIGEIDNRARSRVCISCPEAATLIRHQLRIEFPQTKFSVTSDNNSINISWTDGPSDRAVEDITKNYQFGGFDGMIDMTFHIDRWLYQDGTMSLAHTPGTEGSMGVYSEAIGSPLRGDAVLVTSGPRYTFTHRARSFAAALNDAREYCTRYGLPLPDQAAANENALWNWLHSTWHNNASISQHIHRATEEAAH